MEALYVVICWRDNVGEEAVRAEGASHELQILLANLLWRLFVDCLAKLVLVDIMGLAGELPTA